MSNLQRPLNSQSKFVGKLTYALAICVTPLDFIVAHFLLHGFG